MKRRQFIASGTATAMWLAGLPLAGAQQPALRRVGVLLVGNAAVESFRSEVLGELAKADYVQGRNLILDVRSAEEKLNRCPHLPPN